MSIHEQMDGKKKAKVDIFFPLVVAKEEKHHPM